MNSIGLLILGVVLLIVEYCVPQGPPPLHILMRVIGWICVAVGLILLIAGLLGIPVAFGAVH